MELNRSCISHDRLYQQARVKALTPANIRKGYAATGIWPLSGLSAIPSAFINAPALTESEMEEAREAAWESDALAASLDELEGQQRSKKAKAVLIQASRCLKEAKAANVLFKDLEERRRAFAAAMKSKPRAFRVAQNGQACLYTAAESIAILQAAETQKQEDEAKKRRKAEEKVERKRAKEAEEALAKQRRAAQALVRQQRKAAEALEKEKRQQERLAKKRQREAEVAEKLALKKAKIDRLLAKSHTLPLGAKSSSSATCLPLQPTQLTHHES